AATANGVVSEGSRYFATSFARSTTSFSTVLARRVRSSPRASSSIASSATPAHLESTGRRRPSGRRSENSSTLLLTRKPWSTCAGTPPPGAASDGQTPGRAWPARLASTPTATASPTATSTSTSTIVFITPPRVPGALTVGTGSDTARVGRPSGPTPRPAGVRG